MRISVLLFFSAGLNFAGTFAGTLVDARCWMFEERNVSPRHTTAFVDRDRNREVALLFSWQEDENVRTIVPFDGVSLAFDDAGNRQAATIWSAPPEAKRRCACR